MAINNLEQAAQTVASTGYKVPKYEDKPGDEWMSYVPEAYGELPSVIGEQRKLQAQQLREGAPEVIRQAAQPMARRGLYGSGLQLEDIGQAGLQRQQAIQNAELLAKIDPIKARVAMGDIAQKRFQDRAQESRRRYEKEEAYRQQERAREDLMRQQTGSSLMNMITGKGGVNEALFGKQPTAMEQLLLANEKDPQKRAALSKQMGIGEPSFVLKAAVGEERANQLAKGGIAGAIVSSVIPKEGILGAPIKVIDESLSKIGSGIAGIFGAKSKDVIEKIPDIRGADLSLVPKKESSLEEGKGKWSDPELNKYEESLKPDDFWKKMSNDLEDQARMQNLSYTKDTSGVPQRFSDDSRITYPGTYVIDPEKERAFLQMSNQAQTGQLGGMTFEQEAAIRNMPRVGKTVDIEEAGRLGSLEGGSRIDRSNIEELPVEEIFKKPSITESNLVEQFNEDIQYNQYLPLEEETRLGKQELVETFNQLEPKNYIDAFRDSIPYVPDEALGAAMEADYFQDGLNTTFEQFADEYAPSIGSGMTDSLKGISDLVPGNIVDTGIGLAISSALNPEGLKGVLDNPMSFIGPQIMAQSGVGPLAIGKALATQALPTGAALSSALAGSVIGLPLALAGAGMAKAKKDRARDEAEEIRNRTGSARFNFVPGELSMVGNARRSPALDEANTNFRFTDELTEMNIIYEQDPRRSVNGGKSLSERGQDFAKEAGIDYTNPDPDVQNTSQKWLGKQQRYSELIPGLKPIFMAGLRNEMPRNKVEDAIAKTTNTFFEENTSITGVYKLNKAIENIEHQEEDDIWAVQDQIDSLRLEREELKKNVPDSWKNIATFQPEIIVQEVVEDEQA